MANNYSKIQLRRGTAAHWTEYNTVLDIGEIGFEVDTYKFKIGQINPETGLRYAWNDLEYFGVSDFSGIINIDNEGDGTPGSETCFNGDIIPCSDDTFTLGDALRRWKNVHASNAIQLGDLMLTYGPAGPATGVEGNFLKVNGDDIATRTELEKLTTENVPLLHPTDSGGVPQYVVPLFLEVLERSLPPTEDITTQSQFNAWVVEALKHVDALAHNGVTNEDGDVIIGAPPDVNVIIGPKPDQFDPVPDCNTTLDIYSTTTVHCPLNAKKVVTADQGVKSLGQQPTHFLRANGATSEALPLEQSVWSNVPRI